MNDAYVITQSKDIQWAVDVERKNSVPWKDLLRGRTGADDTCTIRRLLLGMGTQAMQQFVGINVTSYYLPFVLIYSVGLEEKMARLLTACNSVSYLLFSIIGIPNVENWGRRKMMMSMPLHLNFVSFLLHVVTLSNVCFGAVCSFGQFICYLVITICIRYNEAPFLASDERQKYAKASIGFFFLYYVFFGIGWQGVPWLYPTEINSLSMRTKGAALATATNWIVNFLVVEITPPGIDHLGWKFYIIWTVFNFAFVPVVYLLYPETAGRKLEDLDRFFLEKPSLLVFRDKDAILEKRPLKYIQLEEEQVRQHDSAHTGVLDEGLRKRAVATSDEEKADGNTNVKLGESSSHHS